MVVICLAAVSNVLLPQPVTLKCFCVENAVINWALRQKANNLDVNVCVMCLLNGLLCKVNTEITTGNKFFLNVVTRMYFP